MRTYTAVPHEYLEEMQNLTDEEFGRLIRGLIRFSMAGEDIQPQGNEKFYVSRVMTQERRFQDGYEDMSARLSEAGKRGAAKRWGQRTDGLPMGAIGPDGNYNTTQNNTVQYNTKQTTSPRPTGRRSRAAQSAAEERMKKDMEDLERIVAGGAADEQA